MRAVVQRVVRAVVTEVDRGQSRELGRIGPGLVALVGVAADDKTADAAWMARRLAGLRLFDDRAGRLERSVVDAGGSVMVVPNFTVLGDARRGRRPSYARAMAPGPAAELFERLCAALDAAGLTVCRGRFGASMYLELVNDGPVTLVVDSRE